MITQIVIILLSENQRENDYQMIMSRQHQMIVKVQMKILSTIVALVIQRVEKMKKKKQIKKKKKI
jgi:hypothetical protein